MIMMFLITFVILFSSFSFSQDNEIISYTSTVVQTHIAKLDIETYPFESYEMLLSNSELAKVKSHPKYNCGTLKNFRLNQVYNRGGYIVVLITEPFFKVCSDVEFDRPISCSQKGQSIILNFENGNVSKQFSACEKIINGGEHDDGIYILSSRGIKKDYNDKIISSMRSKGIPALKLIKVTQKKRSSDYTAVILKYGEVIKQYAVYGIWETDKAEEYGFKKGDRIYPSKASLTPIKSGDFYNSNKVLLDDIESKERYGTTIYSYNEIIADPDNIFPDLVWSPKPINSRTPVQFDHVGMPLPDKETGMMIPSSPDDENNTNPGVFSHCPDMDWYWALFEMCMIKELGDEEKTDGGSVGWVDYRDYRQYLMDSEYDRGFYNKDGSMRSERVYTEESDKTPVTPRIYDKEGNLLSGESIMTYDPMDPNTSFYLVGFRRHREVGDGHVGTIHVIKKHYWTEEVRDIISRNKRLYKTYFKTNDAREFTYSLWKSSNRRSESIDKHISKDMGWMIHYSGVHPSGYLIYEESGTMVAGIDIFNDTNSLIAFREEPWYIGNSMDRYSKYPDGNDDLEFAVFDMFSAMSGGYVFKMIASPCETVNGPFSIEDRKIWGIYQKYPIVVKRKPRDGSPVVVLIGYLHVINRLGEEKGKNNSEKFSYPPYNDRDGRKDELYIYKDYEYVQINTSAGLNHFMSTDGIKPFFPGGEEYDKNSKMYRSDALDLYERDTGFSKGDATWEIVKHIAVAELLNLTGKGFFALSERDIKLIPIYESWKRINNYVTTSKTYQIAQKVVKGYLLWKETMDILKKIKDSYVALKDTWNGLVLSVRDIGVYYRDLWDRRQDIRLTNITQVFPEGNLIWIDYETANVKAALLDEVQAVHQLVLLSESQMDKINRYKSRQQQNINNNYDAMVEHSKKCVEINKRVTEATEIAKKAVDAHKGDRSQGSTYRLSNVTSAAANIVANANVQLANEKARMLSWMLLSTQYEAQSWSRYKEYMLQTFDYDALKENGEYLFKSRKGDNFWPIISQLRPPSDDMFSGNDPMKRLEIMLDKKSAENN
jgi:hypothetical protein